MPRLLATSLLLLLAAACTRPLGTRCVTSADCGGELDCIVMAIDAGCPGVAQCGRACTALGNQCAELGENWQCAPLPDCDCANDVDAGRPCGPSTLACQLRPR